MIVFLLRLKLIIVDGLMLRHIDTYIRGVDIDPMYNSIGYHLIDMFGDLKSDQ